MTIYQSPEDTPRNADQWTRINTVMGVIGLALSGRPRVEINNALYIGRTATITRGSVVYLGGCFYRAELDITPTGIASDVIAIGNLGGTIVAEHRTTTVGVTFRKAWGQYIGDDGYAYFFDEFSELKELYANDFVTVKNVSQILSADIASTMVYSNELNTEFFRDVSARLGSGIRKTVNVLLKTNETYTLEAGFCYVHINKDGATIQIRKNTSTAWDGAYPDSGVYPSADAYDRYMFFLAPTNCIRIKSAVSTFTVRQATVYYLGD